MFRRGVFSGGQPENRAGHHGSAPGADVTIDSAAAWVYALAMITQKMKYALKALITLAEEAEKPVPEALTIEEIARRSGAPKRFLEHILLEIRNAGVIASTRGRSGGYQLVQDPAQVSISEMLRMIDGPMAPLPCLSRRSYQRCEDCSDEESCRIRRVFAEVFWSYLVLIESLTLADVMQAGPAVLPGAEDQAQPLPAQSAKPNSM